MGGDSFIHTVRSAAGTAEVIIKLPIEHLQSFWQNGEFFEQVMLEHIYTRYRGGTFIDIGSAIGNHTLFFAKFCNPSRVISIEPVKAQVEHQMEILALNNVQDKVQILNVALSETPGIGAMEHFAGSLGQFRLLRGEGDIKVDTLDNVVKELGLSDITLIKIDVEQHEMPLLRGAVETLTKESPGLFIEIVAQSVTPFDKFLSQFGYKRVSERFPRANAYEFRKTANDR